MSTAYRARDQLGESWVSYMARLRYRLYAFPSFGRGLMPLLFLIAALVCPPAYAGKRNKRPINIAAADEAVRKVPQPEEFQLGPGDRISIRVWRHDDLDMDVTIAPDGSITYPLVGRVMVSGMTYPQLVEHLGSAISEYYTDPQVTVNILELKNQKVFIIGEVTSPAVLQLSNQMSILEALTLSGGINPAARTNNVLLIRGGIEKPELYTVDVKAIYAQGNTEQMVFLQRGDIVVVPTKTITNVGRYFKDVQGTLSPFVAGTAIYRNATTGGAQGTSSVIE